MGKDEKKDVMGKIYRQFSRQKYNKYKHQYPKMRQSQIVSKIIREWDSLDLGAKQKLKKQYEQNKILTGEEVSQSQTAKKSAEVKKYERETTIKKDEMVQSSQLRGPQEFQTFVVSKTQEMNDEKELQSSNEKILLKRKMITKIGPTDYITFYRHYHQKYRQEHPRWTSSQISKIIQLQWKKNKNQKRLVSFQFKKNKLERQIKVKKIISGRAAFKNHNKCSGEDTVKMWKHLPLESKKYWENQAQGKKKQVQRQSRLVLKVGSQEGNGLGFLNKMIK